MRRVPPLCLGSGIFCTEQQALKLKGKAFRIGHLWHFNDLMLMGTLSGVEMGLDLAKVPHRSGGVLAAMEVLKGRDVVPMPKVAVA